MNKGLQRAMDAMRKSAELEAQLIREGKIQPKKLTEEEKIEWRKKRTKNSIITWSIILSFIIICIVIFAWLFITPVIPDEFGWTNNTLQICAEAAVEGKISYYNDYEFYDENVRFIEKKRDDVYFDGTVRVYEVTGKVKVTDYWVAGEISKTYTKSFEVTLFCYQYDDYRVRWVNID